MKLPDVRPACATNQLSRGESQRHDSLSSIPKDEDSIYVITKADVDDVGKTIGLSTLTERRRAHRRSGWRCRAGYRGLAGGL
jgi:hypothetical protein